MTQDKPTTPEAPVVPDLKAPAVPPKAVPPPRELPQDDPMPGAQQKGD